MYPFICSLFQQALHCHYIIASDSLFKLVHARVQHGWLWALSWRSGERQVWALQLQMWRCLSQADVGACVGSGLTPCSDEAVVLGNRPRSKEWDLAHRNTRLAGWRATAMLTSRPMIDLGIAFTSSASLSGTLLAPHPSTLGLGGSAWPKSLLPQHPTEPSVLTPQAWPEPALSEAKEPPGGVAWPTTLPSESLLNPQHLCNPFQAIWRADYASRQPCPHVYRQSGRG